MKHAHPAMLALATAGTSILLLSAVLTSPTRAFDTARAAEVSHELARVSEFAISEGYRAAPALMLGLALAVTLPFLTILARLIQPLARSHDATRRYRPGRDDDVVAEVLGDESRGGQPFVEIESSGEGLRCALLRDMLRIGREDDNDIRITNVSVHRYHAAIHREDFDDWHITDLSGAEGNGLIVNGKRCGEARLHDGDIIELGPGKLRFHTGFT